MFPQILYHNKIALQLKQLADLICNQYTKKGVVNIMQTLKVFQVLNEITSFYSSLSLKLTSLDSFLTIQIITQCQIHPQELDLTKAELSVLRKLTASKSQHDTKKSNIFSPQSVSTNVSDQNIPGTENQATGKAPKLNLVQFTLIAIHELGQNYTKLPKRILTKNLMKNVENILVVEQNMSIRNNFLHFDPQSNLGRPMIIIAVDQVKRARQDEDESSKLKKYRYLFEEMERYLSVCDIFSGHINLRVCMYRQQNVGQLWCKEKLLNLIKISMEHEQSEDDLDILLREQIPQNAYIKITNQCGNRVSKQHIRDNPHSYTLISDTQKYYSFKVAKNRQGKIQSILPIDELMIWVVVDGRPLLKLLPTVNSSKNKINTSLRKAKAGSRNDRFEQKRSLLGCTLFEMEDKIDIKTSIKNSPSKQQIQNDGYDDNDSLSCANSQCQKSSSVSSGREQENNQSVPTYIINIDKVVSEGEREKLIEEQIGKILSIVLKERKQVRQNMQINKSMLMIGRIASILQVEEQDVYQVVFVNKL